MGLGAPLWLAGLGLLALPIWLHLLKRHRSTPQHFSSLMFFERSTSASVRQRRLDYILLLLLRLALLALAIFAFAKPFATRALLPAERTGLTILAIDSSASMGSQNKLDRAREEAAKIVDSLPTGASGRVLSFGSSSHLLTGATADKDELKAAIRSIRPTASRSSLGDLAASLRNLGRTTNEPVTVHIFSDLQKTSMPPAFDELRLAAGMALMVHRIEGREKANWTVESVNAPARLLDSASARVEAVVAGFGTPAAARTVVLRVNGEQRTAKTVQVPASGKARVVFDTGLAVPFGFAECEVALAENDTLDADNSFLFAVSRADPERILFASDGSLNDGYLFVQTAIAAVAPSLLSLQHGALTQPLTAAAALILSDPGALTPVAEESLRSYLRGGGAVLITVGPKTSAAGRIPGLGLAVQGSSYAERGSERFQQVSEADQTHPAMGGAGRWETVRFYQTFKVDPGQSKVIARLNDSTPLLIEVRLGEGKALVLASP
ncbi:MAG TPA: VWA domain-containing protein, partial [Bryobacteraceae bacterium]|nr:VWA domain-containing protein [Bryobacteraceae bacterium]